MAYPADLETAIAQEGLRQSQINFDRAQNYYRLSFWSAPQRLCWAVSPLPCY